MATTQKAIALPGAIKGFRSAVDPAALPGGLMAQLNDVRLTDGTIAVRPGTARIRDVITSNFQFRGAADITLNGSRRLLVAGSDGTHVHIYSSQDAGQTFAEITTSSGPYGATTLTDNGKYVTFQVAKDRGILGLADSDMLIIQNGSDRPLIYGLGSAWSTAWGAGTYGVAPISLPPVPANDARATMRFPSGIGLGGSPTLTPSSHIGLAKSASVNGYNAIALTINPSVTSAEYAEIVSGTGVAAGCSWVTFAITASAQSDWQNLTLTLGDGVNTYTIYSPTAPPAAMFFSKVQGTVSSLAGASPGDVYLVSLPMPTGVTNPQNHLRIGWGGTTPTVAKTLGIMMIAGDGTLDYGTNFGIAFGSADTRAIGPGAVVQNVNACDIGACGGLSVQGVLIPLDSRLGYAYDVTVSLPNQPGIDRAFLYRNDAGAYGYYLADTQPISRWSGTAWVSVGSGAPLSVTPFASPDAVTNTARPLPDGAALCVPTGTAMAAANGRLFVSSGSRLYFSDYENPWAFRMAFRAANSYTAQPDPLSGCSLSKDGETIQAIVPLGVQTNVAEGSGDVSLSAASLVMITDRNTYALAGYDVTDLSVARPIAGVGALSPFSVARSGNALYWLSHESQVVCLVGNAVRVLSRLRVDDITKGIAAANLPKVWSAALDGRVYVSTGGGNALVWNEDLAEWESLDRFVGVFDGAALLSVLDPATHRYRLIGLSSAGAVFEHAQPGCGQDFGRSGVLFGVTTGELNTSYNGGLSVAGIGVLAIGSGSIVTSRRTFESTLFSDQLSLNGASWVWDSVQAGSPASAGVQVGLAGTVTGGTKFRAIFAEVRPATVGASRT